MTAQQKPSSGRVGRQTRGGESACTHLADAASRWRKLSESSSCSHPSGAARSPSQDKTRTALLQKHPGQLPSKGVSTSESFRVLGQPQHINDDGKNHPKKLQFIACSPKSLREIYRENTEHLRFGLTTFVCCCGWF